MKLEWSLFAIEDRNNIFDYVEQDNPYAAVIIDKVSTNKPEHSCNSRNAAAQVELKEHGNW